MLSTQAHPPIPHYLTPYSYPLQSINILSGTKESLNVPTMKNMESAPVHNTAVPVHSNTMDKPKTPACYGYIYPKFYAGPHTGTGMESADYGFRRDMPKLKEALTFLPNQREHHDVHHRHEKVKHATHHHQINAGY